MGRVFLSDGRFIVCFCKVVGIFVKGRGERGEEVELKGFRVGSLV